MYEKKALLQCMLKKDEGSYSWWKSVAQSPECNYNVRA